jgi:DNA-binding CsgD family transcriptional regulator
MSQVAPQLVGRPVELGVFDDALAELADGRSAAIELVGEPGIGKTRLLDELATRADARGFLVLSGSASELERDLPFWLFVDALDEYVGAIDPRQLDTLEPQTLGELAHVFASLSDHDSAEVPLLRDERYRTHRAVRELLAVVGADKPLVLILDDLHWADSGSIELLGALLRRPPPVPMLLAMGMRPRQAPERLAAAFERAHRVGRLARLELESLSLADARELLGAGLDAGTATALYEESGGNPFYLEQLARSVGRGGTPSSPMDDMLVAVEVPRAVVAALTEELGQLADDARLVLQGAAVAGDPFEPELVAAAAGVAEADTVDALDVLLGADLVRPTEVPRRFRFRHPLVRRAVYDASPAGWRLGAHQRCADALAERGASASARAHHVERCGRQGDVEAIAVLREAGSAMAQRTPAGAARWFSAALRLLRDDAPAEGRVELLTALAGARAATGQFEEARAALLQSIELLPPDSGALRVRLTAACAGIEQLLGRHAEAHARLEGSLAALDDQRSPQAASLMITLALDAFFRQENAASQEWAMRALDVAREVGDAPLIAAAGAAVALACAFVESTETAEHYRVEAAALIDGMADEELAVRLDAIAYLTGAEVYLDRFEEAAAHGRRGLALARATGQGALLPMLIQASSTGLAVQGRLVEAAELLDGAIEGARLAGNDQSLAWDLLNRAFVSVQLGDLETAVATADESVELTRDLEQSFVSTYAGLLQAITRMETGDHERAVELFLGACGGLGMPRIPGGWRAKYLELMTRSLLALGRRREAEESVSHADALATATGLRTAAGWAHRAAAWVALDEGQTDVAVTRALSSVASFDEAGTSVEAAVSRTVAARGLAQTGERDRAVAELEHAVATLDAAGAVRFRLEAERELGKLGHRAYRRTRRGRTDGTGIDALTERELELALLVVDRRTNPEIAAQLFLSQKTVETHLRNIFRKVGVSSRVELARAVEQQRRAVAHADQQG